MQDLMQESIITIQARKNMVQNQLMPSGIIDNAVLEAFLSIPRHLFVGELDTVAYSDGPLYPKCGRVISDPVTFAKMLQACAIKKNDTVLDIGCALGYSSAILGFLAKEVTAIESDIHLVTTSKYNLASLNINNVSILLNALAYGYPDNGPYNIIFVNGALKQGLNVLIDQLSNGGKLAIIEQTQNGIAMSALYKKHQDHLDREYISHSNINYID